MCGRYTISQAERLRQHYERIEAEGLLVPRFNVAPSQTVPVVLDESPTMLSAARWGLIPVWAKDKKIGNSLINARAETVSTKPAFRSAFKKRRCLIPADGFYEWQNTPATAEEFGEPRQDLRNRRPHPASALAIVFRRRHTFLNLGENANASRRSNLHQSP